MLQPLVVGDLRQDQKTRFVPSQAKLRVVIVGRLLQLIPPYLLHHLHAKAAISPIVRLSVDCHLLHQGNVVDGR